ncbi:hypothetical protein ACO0LF_14980 [Undibacterium sp. Di27W]|uniref:hypothetical protein n=1 Tax=Undibacterium sp. Di27W TaxID=3413036 RepID=UPI003BEF81AC
MLPASVTSHPCKGGFIKALALLGQFCISPTIANFHHRTTRQFMPQIHPHVLLLAEFLSKNPGYSDDTINVYLNSAGLNDQEIFAITMCVQAAWGQRAVSHTGAKSSNEYVFANGAGEILRRGSFKNDAYFNSALELYDRYSPYEGCIRFARESAAYNTVQNSIASGHDVSTSTPLPQIAFVDEFTAEGLVKIIEKLRVQTSAPTVKAKAWWKFW